MKCPVCQETLALATRDGVEIDYCPKCRGVWLDRGELEKIIQRASAAQPEAGPPPGYAQQGYPQPGYPPQDRRRLDDSDDDWSRRPPDQHGHRRKRGGFLRELFDFD